MSGGPVTVKRPAHRFGPLIEVPRRGDVVKFNPERHRLTVAALNYGIEEARRIRDWPKLEQAVDAKVEEQRKFYAWWQAGVAHGGGSKNRDRGSYSLDQAEKLTGMKQQRVSDLGKWLNKPDDTYRRHLLGAAYRAAMLDDEHNHHAQGDEWFTPVEIIERVRTFFGGRIDCDPATTKRAQETIRATTFFTVDDDGLAHNWFGRTFLNGPYGDIAPWVDKLIGEHAAGRVIEAIALTNSATGTQWFRKLFGVAAAICFVSGRIKFLDANGCEAPNGMFDQALFYLGPRADEFARAFGSVGYVVDPTRWRVAA
jgi:DNA N-6-adenine-methyltransferase (Dam)